MQTLIIGLHLNDVIKDDITIMEYCFSMETNAVKVIHRFNDTI